MLMATILTACSKQASGPVQSELQTVIATDRAIDDRRIARVNGSDIYASDVLLFAKAQGQLDAAGDLNVDDPKFSDLLQELINQRLLALDAVKSGLNEDPEARQRLAT